MEKHQQLSNLFSKSKCEKTKFKQTAFDSPNATECYNNFRLSKEILC